MYTGIRKQNRNLSIARSLGQCPLVTVGLTSGRKAKSIHEPKMTLPAKARHVQRVLLSLGVNTKVTQLSESTRTAKEAASALNCALGQIVKSLVFRVNDNPILVLVSGSNHVDERLLESLVGSPIQCARADFVRQHTGHAIGGVAPIGHPKPIPTFVDGDLLNYEQVWAAAGGPYAVFSCEPSFLATLGEVIRVTPAAG